MPAFVFAALAGAAASSGAAAFAGTAFSWAAFGSAFAGSLILGGLSKALAKSPANPGANQQASSVYSAQGRNLSLRQPIAPWEVWLGECAKGGVITFGHLSSDKRYFHMIVTVACHQVASIDEIILNDQSITDDMLNADGVVISGDWGRYQPVARVHSAAVPSSPYQITTTYDVDSVQSVSIADTYGDVENGFTTVNTVLQDVSPSSPGNANQYSRSGNVFTFYSSRAAATATINYTEQELHSGLRIKKSLGDETTQPFPDLVAESEGKWTDAHRQTGHAKIYLRFLVEGLGGALPNVKVVGRGALTYDPRSATTKYSPNAALAAAWYLCDDEIGFDALYADEIDDATLQATASVCDERVLVTGDAVTFTASASSDRLTLASTDDTVTARSPRTGDGVRLTTTGTLPAGLATGTTYYAIRKGAYLIKLASSYANALAGTAINITDAGSGTHTLTPYDEARYTVNGSFVTSERRGDVLDRLIGSMAGRSAHVSDVWYLHAGAYDSPSITLDDSELAGAIQINPMLGTNDSANGAKGVFTDPGTWQSTDFPAVDSATYLSLDGSERVWADLDLTGFVTSAPTAQRLAKIELRRRRYAMTFTATFMLSAYRAMTARTVAVTFARYGWTAQQFEVVNSRFMVITGDAGPTLGVELTLRQSDSAIWDWSVSDQAAQVAVRNTTLPNPANVVEPGVPTVTESLYETTGSAGVKSRIDVSFAAPEDALVDRYEIRYKAITDAAYIDLPPQTATTLQINDLAAGGYLIGVRSVNTFNQRSAWVTVVAQLLGLTAAPANVANFTIIASSGFALASWNLSDDLDVRIGGRVQIRHSPDSVAQTWEDGVVLDEFNGDAVASTPLPLMQGTYMAKFVDSTGNFSLTMASFVATEGMVTGFTTVGSRDIQAAGFPGDKINMFAGSGVLKIDSANTITTQPGNISTWPKMSSLGGVSATGSYRDSSYVDCTTQAVRRWQITVKAASYDTGDTIANRTSNISSWPSMGGTTINDCDVTPLVSTTNDNPAGSPCAWSDYVPFFVADLNCRAARFGLDAISGNPTHNIAVSRYSVTAKEAV